MSWSDGLQVACTSVSRVSPDRGMNLKEFTMLLRKVARIVPTLATDEEIATIFELAQDEQNQTKGKQQRHKRPDEGSELWSRRAQPSRQSLLRRERECRDDAAGFVSGLEIAQLISDLLGDIDSDILLQQSSASAPPEAGRKVKQRKRHSQLKQAAKGEDHENHTQPKPIQGTSRLPARCLSAAAPLYSNHSTLVVTSSSADVVRDHGPYSPSLHIGSPSSTTRALRQQQQQQHQQQQQQHDAKFTDDTRTTLEQTSTVVRPTAHVNSSLQTAHAELTLYLDEAAKRPLTEQLEISSADPTFTSGHGVGRSSMELPHDLTPPSSRSTSDASPRPQPAAEEEASERWMLPHGITPPSSPSPQKDAAGASAAMRMAAIGEELEVVESAELERVLAESASWLMQTEAARLHLTH
eukprot:COSAG02_NODE_11000_length_1814_cov_1.050146_1_plen_411_part_00